MATNKFLICTLVIIVGHSSNAQQLFFKPGILKQKSFSHQINYYEEVERNTTIKPDNDFFRITGLYLGLSYKKGSNIYDIFYAENKATNHLSLRMNECNCKIGLFGSYYKNYNRIGAGYTRELKKEVAIIKDKVKLKFAIGGGLNALITSKVAFNKDTFSALIPTGLCRNGYGFDKVRFHNAPIERNTMGYFIKSGIIVYYKNKPRLNIDIVYSKALLRTYRTWYDYYKITCDGIKYYSGFIENKAKNINIEFTVPIKLYERK
jgi:hypothetical protein